jgi:hypothetical protein
MNDEPAPTAAAATIAEERVNHGCRVDFCPSPTTGSSRQADTSSGARGKATGNIV